MKKKTMRAFGKTIYLLGKDKEGINYWLEEPSWDCGWYWGFGYVETYTNNTNPSKARDISSHQHFDSLFLKGNKCAYDMFKGFFAETPLTNDEIWELVDYMYTFYTLRETAELFEYGYSHQTERAKIESLKNKDQHNLVNKNYYRKYLQELKRYLLNKTGTTRGS